MIEHVDATEGDRVNTRAVIREYREGKLEIRKGPVTY
jgi:hypothetical protein